MKDYWVASSYPHKQRMTFRFIPQSSRLTEAICNATNSSYRPIAAIRERRKTPPRVACLGKPIIQTIGCNEHSGTVFFTPRAGIGP